MFATLLSLLILSGPRITENPETDRARQYVMQVQEFVASTRDRQGMLSFDKTMTAELIKLIPKVENGRARSILVHNVSTDSSLMAQGALESWALTPDAKLAKVAIDCLGSKGWLGVAPLLRIYRKGEHHVRVACVKGLLDRCQYRPTDQRIRTLLVKLMQDDDPALRILASTGLERIAVFWHADKDAGMSVYPQVLDSDALMRVCFATVDDDREVKTHACELVTGFARGFLRSVSREEQFKIQPEPELVKHMATDSNWIVRSCYLTFVAIRVGETRAHVAALADDSPEVRTLALRILERHVSRDWFPLIGNHCKDKRAGVRAVAVELLGKTYSEDVLPYVRPLLKDPDPSVRAAAKLAGDRISGSTLKT